MTRLSSFSMIGSALLLVSMSSTRAAELGAYSGNYDLGKGHIVAIAESEFDPAAPRVLAFTDFSTGRFGVLTGSTPEHYTLHAAAFTGAPVAEISFERSGGDIVALQITPNGGTSQRAKRMAAESEELSFDSGDARLAGTLLLPPGRGPFPAIVLVPAGRLHRTATSTFPYFFLAQGYAVLMYDGRTDKAPFETYAQDAVAAVTALRTHERIDAKRVGLWGHSQGGWLALIAASQSDAVSFVIDHSGMLVPAWQQELYRLAAEAAADGVEPKDVAAAVTFETELMEVARSGRGWDRLRAQMANANAAKAGWLELVYQPEDLDELQQVWRDDFAFDPRPYAAKVRQPVLALFGGLDRSTPIESAANLVNARGGRPGLTVRFFATADHAFLEGVTGGPAEIPSLTRFAPGMFEAIRQWLQERNRPGS